MDTRHRPLQGRCPANPQTYHFKASRARVPMTLWCGSDLFFLSFILSFFWQSNRVTFNNFRGQKQNTWHGDFEDNTDQHSVKLPKNPLKSHISNLTKMPKTWTTFCDNRSRKCHYDEFYLRGFLFISMIRSMHEHALWFVFQILFFASPNKMGG